MNIRYKVKAQIASDFIPSIITLSASVSAAPFGTPASVTARALPTTCTREYFVDCICNYEDLSNVPMAQCPPPEVAPASCAPILATLSGPTTTAPYAGPLAEDPSITTASTLDSASSFIVSTPTSGPTVESGGDGLDQDEDEDNDDDATVQISSQVLRHTISATFSVHPTHTSTSSSDGDDEDDVESSSARTSTPIFRHHTRTRSSQLPNHTSASSVNSYDGQINDDASLQTATVAFLDKTRTSSGLRVAATTATSESDEDGEAEDISATPTSARPSRHSTSASKRPIYTSSPNTESQNGNRSGSIPTQTSLQTSDENSNGFPTQTAVSSLVSDTWTADDEAEWQYENAEGDFDDSQNQTGNQTSSQTGVNRK